MFIFLGGTLLELFSEVTTNVKLVSLRKFVEGLLHTADNIKIIVHYRMLTQSILTNTISKRTLWQLLNKNIHPLLCDFPLVAGDVTFYQVLHCFRGIDKCMFSTEADTESLREVSSLCQNNGCIFMEKQ